MKLGAEELLEEPPAEALPAEEVLSVEPVELLEPEAEGVDEDVDGLDDDGLDDEDEDCATASDDSANRTAAVVMLRALGMISPGGLKDCA